MLAVLDLDYTLLDTARLKKEMGREFAACGVSPERFVETYRMTVEADPNAYDYDPVRHVAMVSDELTCGQEELLDRVNRLLGDLRRFLYPGTEDFLRALRSMGARLVLVTLGNESWQRRKVSGCGLDGLLDEVTTAISDKVPAVAKLVAAEDTVVVVNDNCDEIWRMSESLPGLIYLAKRGPKGVPDGFAFPVFDTYEEILGEIGRRIKTSA